jgi:hypothetical protein
VSEDDASALQWEAAADDDRAHSISLPHVTLPPKVATLRPTIGRHNHHHQQQQHHHHHHYLCKEIASIAEKCAIMRPTACAAHGPRGPRGEGKARAMPQREDAS